MIERLLAPRVVFGFFAAMIILTIICTPEMETGAEQAHLTSYSNDERGARGLFQVVERLGWRVERRTEAMRAALDSATVYAVLSPVTGFTASEVHNLLEAVRAGAGLLYVLPYGDSPLSDSLGLKPTRHSFQGLGTAQKPPPRASPYHERFAELYDGVPNRAVFVKRPIHDDTRIFLQAVAVDPDSASAPVAIGLPLGDGRVAVVADPELLRNDFIRETDYALLPVRLLEWVAPGERRTIVFDEFHQGFGRHPSLVRAIRMLLLETPSGRVLAQLTAALVLLLVASATRAIAPRPLQRIERRSPLEHVGALARAYEQVSAARLVTRRLVHGVRRRHATGAARALDDDAYLRALAARHPHLAPDVERTIAALERSVPPAELLAVGQSIDHIERTLST